MAAATETAAASPSILPTLAASASANSLARIPCHPIDTIKSKLQVQGKGAAGSASGGPLAVVRGVLKTEGIGGLYSGIGITVLGVQRPSPPARLLPAARPAASRCAGWLTERAAARRSLRAASTTPPTSSLKPGWTSLSPAGPLQIRYSGGSAPRRSVACSGCRLTS